MNKLILAFTLVLSQLFAFGTFAAEKLTKVENEKVCMVTDMYFAKKQIPVEVEKKTYYGCCQNCKATLGKDAAVRTGTDPVSGKPVDKATAFIAAKEDNSVLYFENEKNFKAYQSKLK